MAAKVTFKTKQDEMVYVIRKLARFLWQAYGTSEYKELLAGWDSEEAMLNVLDQAHDLVGDSIFAE